MNTSSYRRLAVKIYTRQSMLRCRLASPLYVIILSFILLEGAFWSQKNFLPVTGKNTRRLAIY